MQKINLLSLFAFLELSTNSRGVKPVSRALENIEAASSKAPPKRLPMVNRPEASDEIKSLPAREATIVFMAPDTAGPWSAVSMSTISMNLVAHGGRPRRGRINILVTSKIPNQSNEKKHTAFEPQQTNDTPKTNILLEHIRNPHTSVQQLLATLVRDR